MRILRAAVHLIFRGSSAARWKSSVFVSWSQATCRYVFSVIMAILGCAVHQKRSDARVFFRLLYYIERHPRSRMRFESRLRRRMNKWPPNVERLILGCIGADFCKILSILVWKLLPRYTRFIDFCSAPSLKIQQKSCPKRFRVNNHFSKSRVFQNFPRQSLPFLRSILMNFCRNFATLLRKCKV